MTEEKKQIETVGGAERPLLPVICVMCKQRNRVNQYYCLECRREIARRSYHKNKERNRDRYNAKHREYIALHREEINSKAREYWKTDGAKRARREWDLRNKERRNEQRRAYYERNKPIERIRAITAYRLKRNLIGQVCMICSEPRCVEWCHIIPRCKGGVNHEWNILYLCPTHHRIFDNARDTFTREEWERIDARVREAETHR